MRLTVHSLSQLSSMSNFELVCRRGNSRRSFVLAMCSCKVAVSNRTTKRPRYRPPAYPTILTSNLRSKAAGNNLYRDRPCKRDPLLLHRCSRHIYHATTAREFRARVEALIRHVCVRPQRMCSSATQCPSVDSGLESHWRIRKLRYPVPGT